MRQERHKPEQIVAKLRRVDVPLSRARPVAEALWSIGMTRVTCSLWRKAFGGWKTGQAKPLDELEKKDERLRNAVSDLTSGKLILREAASGNV
ncbi:hypothetical protein B5V46_08530 [Rhodovulum sp. MB263]|nr:hypothetical protein B5V46_08530 [Rhodovulum sp. MB263]